MPDCRTVQERSAAYVDGELIAADRQGVESHLRACARCRSLVAAEQSVQQAIHASRSDLSEVVAPQALKSRCTMLAFARDVARPAAWYTRTVPMTIAATLVFAVAGATLNWLTQSSVRVVAAELAADHVKCAMVNSLFGTSQEKQDAERWLASSFAWDTHLPDQASEAGLEFVGARTCLYGEGRVAHVMYRHGGRPVSLFMLPNRERARGLVAMDVMGHREAMWSSAGRTFVLVSDAPRAESERLASLVRTALR